MPTAALPRVPVFSSFRLLPSFFRFPSCLTPFLYCLLCLPLSLSLSPYFTQQTNPSAHCVPATLLRLRNELQHAFSTPEKSTVWRDLVSCSDLRWIHIFPHVIMHSVCTLAQVCMHTPTLCAEEETRKCWGYPTNMAANLNFQVTNHIFFFNFNFI